MPSPVTGRLASILICAILAARAFAVPAEAPTGASPRQERGIPSPEDLFGPIEFRGDQIVLDGFVGSDRPGDPFLQVFFTGPDGQSRSQSVDADDEGRATLAFDARGLRDEDFISIVTSESALSVETRRLPGKTPCVPRTISTNVDVPPCACSDCPPPPSARTFTGGQEAQASGVGAVDGATVTTLPMARFDSRSLDFEFTIFHQSLKVCDGEVGQSASHNWNSAVVQTGADSGFFRTASMEVFPIRQTKSLPQKATTAWTVPEGFFSRLVRDDAVGRWILTHHAGTTYEFVIGVEGQPGSLVAIRDPNGNRTRVFRNRSGALAAVETDLDQPVSFAYDGDGHLASMTDHLGRTWAFDYDENDNLSSVTAPATEYADLAAGEEVTDTTLPGVLVTRGRRTTFSYEDPNFPHHITRITDDRGAVPVEITYYHEPPNAGRVRTKKINGRDVTFLYDPSAEATPAPLPPLDEGNTVTRVIDREGNVVDYEMHGPGGGPVDGLGKLGLRRKVTWTERGKGNAPLHGDEPLYWERRWLHDCDCLAPARVSQPFRSDEGLAFDELGMPVDYPTEIFEYNDRRQVTRYEYRGFGESTRWEKTYDTFESFSRERTYTEPRAFDDNALYAGLDFLHRYTYDERGNRVRYDAPAVTRGVAVPQAITEVWTYNEHGQRTSHTDANGNLTRYTYFDGPTTGGDINTRGQFGGYLASSTRGAAESADPAPELITTYRVNALGMVTQSTDPRGFVEEHEFNDLGERVRVLEPEVTLRNGQRVRYEQRYIYDGAGNRVMARRSNVDLDGAVPANAFLDRSSSFDAVNNRLSSRVEVDADDANDLVTRYAYDGNDQLAAVVRPEGNRTFHVYDERRLRFKTFYGVAAAAEPGKGIAPQIPDYPSDKRAEDLGATPFVGFTVETYDSRLNPQRTRDGRGNFAERFYDFFNRRTATRDANGNGTVYRYDDGSHLLTQVGGTVSQNGALTEVLSRTYHRFDEIGRRYQTVLDLHLEDEEADQLDPDDGRNTDLRTFFDPGSRVARRLDARDNPTDFAYDAANRRVSETDALANVRTYRYDGNSNLTALEELEVPGPGAVGPPELYVTTYVHDELDRLVESHVLGLDGTSIDHETLFAYDSRHNQRLTGDAEGRFILTTFDDLDRMTRRRRFDGDPTTGAPAELSHHTYAYDTNSRRIAEAVLAEVNNPGSEQVTRYAYDDLDRWIRTVYADSDDPIDGASAGPDGVFDRVELDYDENSNPIVRRDQRGVVFRNRFDPGNRLTRQRIELPPSVPGVDRQEFRYDALDRLVDARNNFVRVVRHYDPLSRRKGETQRVRLDGSGFVRGWQSPVRVRNLYDRQSNRTRVRVISGLRGALETELDVRYSFDALNRVDDVSASSFGRPFADVASYAYLGPSRVQEKRLAPGARLTQTFDVKRRVAEHSWRSAAPSDETLVGFAYTYDDLDHPLHEIFRHDGDRADNFGYNARYEVTGVGYREAAPSDYRTRIEAFPTTFAYDDNFNRTAASFGDPFASTPNTEAAYTVNPANEYSRVTRRSDAAAGLVPTAHDAAGNMTRLPARPASGDMAANREIDLAGRWDAFSLLYTAIPQDGGAVSGILREDYRYDPLRRRIARFHVTEEGCEECPRLELRRYVYDGWSVISERLFEAAGASDAPGNLDDRLERVYVNGAHIDEPILVAIDGDGDGRLAEDGSRNRPGGVDFEYFFLCNRLGSVMGLLDAGDGETVLELYRYDVYGARSVFQPGQEGTAALESKFANTFAFTGRRLDPETGLYYYRYRYFSPTLGRFVGRDPIGYTGNSLSLYGYVENRSTFYVDWAGLIQGKGKYKCCGDKKGEQPWKTVSVNVVLAHGASDNSKADIKRANEVYEQCCVKIVNAGTTTWSQGLTESLIGTDLVLDEYTVMGKPTREEKKMTEGQGNNGILYAYYVKGLSQRSTGEAFRYGAFGTPPAPALVRSNQGRAQTFSHELYHVLADESHNDAKWGDKNVAYSRLKDDAVDLKEAQCDKIRQNTKLVS